MVLSVPEKTHGHRSEALFPVLFLGNSAIPLFLTEQNDSIAVCCTCVVLNQLCSYIIYPQYMKLATLDFRE